MRIAQVVFGLFVNTLNYITVEVLSLIVIFYKVTSNCLYDAI